MHGGAVSLAAELIESGFEPELILASDMLDLALFTSLIRNDIGAIPAYVYFHENQITYPWSPKDRDIKNQRDHHYGFINLTTALTADRVFFNSEYHMHSFIGALPDWLKKFPDKRLDGVWDKIAAKSSVLPLGMDLSPIDALRDGIERSGPPLLLWNHRWEYDKNPDGFYDLIRELDKRDLQFELILLGEQFDVLPEALIKLKNEFADRIKFEGYADSNQEYLQWLLKADILPVTSIQDFFGGSVVEAIYASTYPILPNRLAYPEHIPESRMLDFFYSEPKELIERVASLIHDISELRYTQTADLVAKYDWNKIITLYDEFLSKELSRT